MPLIISNDVSEIQPEDYIEPQPIVQRSKYRKARLVFFTMPEMEAQFEAQYQTDLRNYQLPPNSRYTAYAFVEKPPRVFEVYDAAVNAIFCNGSICPTGPENGGGIYILDSKFINPIADFQEDHPRYRVVFYPSGQSPTLHYCAEKNVFPAKLMSMDGSVVLNIEDDSKYDIAVL